MTFVLCWRGSTNGQLLDPQSERCMMCLSLSKAVITHNPSPHDSLLVSNGTTCSLCSFALICISCILQCLTGVAHIQNFQISNKEENPSFWQTRCCHYINNTANYLTCRLLNESYVCNYSFLPDWQGQCLTLDDYYQHSHEESSTHLTENGLRVPERQLLLLHGKQRH